MGRTRLRARTLALGTVAAVAVAATAAGAATLGEVPAEWDVGGVAPGGRAIDVFFNSGGCGVGGHGSAVETADSVTLTVTETVFADPNAVCPAIYLRGFVRIPLAAPLDGRAIRGRTVPRYSPIELETFAPGARPDTLRFRVPRLVGMSPWEAKRGLAHRHLEVRIRTTAHTGRRTQVLSQAPAPGSAIEQHGTVRLRIGLR
jgi:hypothetical protein